MNIDLYTDGSCNNKYEVGAWASVICLNGERISLSGIEENTTHNRMELVAVIKSLEYLYDKQNFIINLYSDSQYVIHLIDRKDKLTSGFYKTKKGNAVQNEDLVKRFFSFTDVFNLNFIKVKAHQKKSDVENLNREVDMKSRRILRDYLKKQYK